MSRLDEFMCKYRNDLMCNQTDSRKEGGFSLVELAVALMVIAALIVMLLKGHDIIQSVRVHQTVKHIKLLEAGIGQFIQRYGQLPGDIPNPEDFIPNCTTANNCLPGGDGNGAVHNATHEAYLGWHAHLLLLDLIPESVAGSYIRPEQRMPHFLATQDMFLFIHALNVKVAEKIDRMIDDGKPKTGQLRVNINYNNCVMPTGNSYNIHGNSDVCNLEFFIKH